MTLSQPHHSPYLNYRVSLSHALQKVYLSTSSRALLKEAKNSGVNLFSPDRSVTMAVYPSFLQVTNCWLQYTIIYGKTYKVALAVIRYAVIHLERAMSQYSRVYQ